MAYYLFYELKIYDPATKIFAPDYAVNFTD